MKKINISKPWLLLIISIVISISILFFTFSYSKSVINESNKEKVLSEYLHLKNRVNIFQDDKKAYISVLANHSDIFNYLDNKNSKNENKIKNIFQKQIKNLNLVMQIRLLSLEGKELIRVDNKSNNLKVAKDDDLQNNYNREYFKEFIKLEKNEMGISNLNLNKEFGKIEKPFKSTIKIAMPVYEKNIKRALIIINYNMENWLDEYIKSSYLDIYLIDKDGYFIIHADKKYNWSRYLKNKIDVRREFNLDINNLKSIKSKFVKELKLWDKNKYYIVYDYKNTQSKQLFIEQTKVISISIILAIFILILPFLKIIFDYIRRLKESEDKISRILDNSLDSVIMINQKGIIQTVNNIAIETFAYEKNELIGKNINILIPKLYYSKHDEYINNQNEKTKTKISTIEKELFGIDKNGKMIPITVIITKIFIEKELFFIGTIRNIKAEKQTNKLFENLFKESPLGIALVLENGNFWRLSEKFCSIIGYKNEELIKLSFHDITHPNDLEIDLSYANKLITKELDRFTLEKRYIHKSGKIIWISLSVSPVFFDENKDKLEYFIAMIEDITEKKRVLEKLLEAEKLSSIGHWDWNIDEDNFYLSKTMLNIFGKANENFSATYENLIEVVHPEDRERVNTNIQHSFNNNIQFNMEYRIIVDNEIRFIQAKGNTTYLNGNPIKMFGTCQDITELKELQKREKIQEHLLMQQSKLVSMGEMVASIAHQWRQPLNSIGLTIQDLLPAYRHNELDESYIIESRDEIMSQLNYMSNTIDEFRNFFKKSNTIISFNIIDSLNEVISLYWAQLKQNAISLNIQVLKNDTLYNIDDLKEEDKKEFIIENQPSELKQVIINHIGNSKDAIINLEKTEPAQRVITILLEKKDLIEINIIDFAGGITKENQNRIFEPYFSTKKMGTGLGLYISKMIIEKSLHGKIRYKDSKNVIDSKVYKGSTFIISLPENLD